MMIETTIVMMEIIIALEGNNNHARFSHPKKKSVPTSTLRTKKTTDWGINLQGLRYHQM